MRYRTIVADPPWPYGAGAITKTVKTDGRISVGVDVVDHYEVMSMDVLCALRLPADDDAHLYLWTTNAFMVEAHDLADAWGFKPKTMLTWAKVHQSDPMRISM